MYKSNKDIDLKNSKDRDRFYRKFTDEQRELFSAIKNNIFVFVRAKAGCAKTSTSIATMVDMLANGDINSIVYIQKPSQRTLSQGFLPGDLDNKSDVLWGAFYGSMLDLGITPDMVEVMIESKLIQLTTDVTLRGITLSNVGVIVDEGQNLDYLTLKLIFTRCADSSHVVLLGDENQKDNKGINTDFIKYGEYLSGTSVGAECYLTKNFRGKFSRLSEDFIMEDK